MTATQKFSLLMRLDDLIKRKATGPPARLTEKLGVSRASIFRYINELKEMDAPIQYCKERQSYFYEIENFVLKIV